MWWWKCSEMFHEIFTLRAQAKLSLAHYYSYLFNLRECIKIMFDWPKMNGKWRISCMLRHRKRHQARFLSPWHLATLVYSKFQKLSTLQEIFDFQICDIVELNWIQCPTPLSVHLLVNYTNDKSINRSALTFEIIVPIPCLEIRTHVSKKKYLPTCSSQTPTFMKSTDDRFVCTTRNWVTR